jgi:hypothetical protein
MTDLSPAKRLALQGDALAEAIPPRLYDLFEELVLYAGVGIIADAERITSDSTRQRLAELLVIVEAALGKPLGAMFPDHSFAEIGLQAPAGLPQGEPS